MESIRKEFESYCRTYNIHFGYDDFDSEDYSLLQLGWINNIFRVVCKHGILELAKWLHKKGVIRIIKHPHETFCGCGGYNIKVFRFSRGYISACQYGQLNIIQWMYSVNHKFLTCNTFCAEGFFYACESGRINIVEWFITKFKDNKAALYDVNFKHGVEYCCQYGHLELLQFLYSSGHVDDDMIYNGFINSCIYRHINIVKWICQIKEIPKCVFDTALSRCSEYEQPPPELVELLIKNSMT